MEDPWTIKKVLVQGYKTELVIPEEAATHHILNHLNPEMRAQVDSEGGLKIPVLDWDTCMQFELTLKRQQQLQGVFPGGSRCVFTGGWSEHFVERRKLRYGDEIGLAWLREYNTLYFTVLTHFSEILAEMQSLGL